VPGAARGENEQGPCPFCAIASGKDRSIETVCEGTTWLAFFPLDPATLGHTLVIPRRHVRDLWSVDRPVAEDLIHASIRVGHAIESALEPDGMNLITSSGPAAEQTVLHLHLHVVPRWRNDGVDIWPPARPIATKAKRDAARRIRQACRES
jgi:diadenosine tetraphosphate (Ap4A) HIT family hydrolase